MADSLAAGAVSNEKVNRRKNPLFTNRGKWTRFSASPEACDLIAQFVGSKMGGDQRLLRYLWAHYEAPPPPSAQVLWKKLKATVDHVSDLRDAIQEHERYHLVGLDQHVDGLQNEAEVGFEFATLPRGKQPSWIRHYWGGALVPYLELTTGRPQWKWLSAWLSAIEGEILDPNQVRAWAGFVRRTSVKPKNNTPDRGSRQHVHDQLAALYERHRRDHVAASKGALSVVEWFKRTTHDALCIKRYIQKAHHRWPFFVDVLPNASYLRKS